VAAQVESAVVFAALRDRCSFLGWIVGIRLPRVLFVEASSRIWFCQYLFTVLVTRALKVNFGGWESKISRMVGRLYFCSIFFT
jgi:hypothetical protein